MGISVELNKAAVAARIKAATQKAQIAMAEQALQDSNQYARHDQGQLIESSIIASQPDKGLLVWDTPYAKKVYYLGTPAKDVNPNASIMWVHKARAAHGKQWEDIAQKIIKKEV